MKIQLTLLFGFLCFLGIAQDYQIVRSTDVHYFMADNYDSDYDPILAVRIDSLLVVAGDTVLYPFKTIRENPGDLTGLCDFIRSGSWIGHEIIIENDGTNIILNAEFDSIYIETAANLNDSFLVYKYDSGDSIMGKVTAVEELSFMGFTDSVKTITLSSDSGIFNLTSDKIKLSKHHGIYQLFPFYAFPDSYEPALNVSDEYTLCGQDFPKLGITRPTIYEINNLEIGDEYFMVNRHYGDYVHETIDSNKYTLIEKTPVNPLVNYYKFQIDTYSEYVEVSIFIPYDTTEHKIYYQHIYESTSLVTDDYTSPYLPGESVFYSNGSPAASFSTFSNYYSPVCGFVFSEKKVVINLPAADTINCFTKYPITTGNRIICKHQISGANSYFNLGGSGGVSGGAHIYITFGDYEQLDTIDYHQLVYKKNSGVLCGDMPVTFISTPQNELANALHVYPNPTTGLIRIESELTWESYRLLSLTGAEIDSGEMTNLLDISKHPAGIYILEIRLDDQVLRMKIIKN